MDSRLTETNKCGVGTALGNEWHRNPSPRAGSSIGSLSPRVKVHLGNKFWASLSHEGWVLWKGHGCRASGLGAPNHVAINYPAGQKVLPYNSVEMAELSS